jgi:hypothetical protein
MARLTQQPGLAASTQLERLLKDYNDLLTTKEDRSDRDLIVNFRRQFLRHTPSTQTPTRSRSAMDPSIDLLERTSMPVAEKTGGQETVVLRGYQVPNKPGTASLFDKSTDPEIFRKPDAAQNEEERYLRLIALDTAASDANNPTVANDLYNLGLFYISQERYPEAKPIIERALFIYDAAYGYESLISKSARSTLAMLNAQTDSADQSARLSSILERKRLSGHFY